MHIGKTEIIERLLQTPGIRLKGKLPPDGVLPLTIPLYEKKKAKIFAHTKVDHTENIVEAMKLLVRDPTCKLSATDSHGKTLLDLAKESKRKDVVSLFRTTHKKS